MAVKAGNSNPDGGIGDPEDGPQPNASQLADDGKLPSGGDSFECVDDANGESEPASVADSGFVSPLPEDFELATGGPDFEGGSEKEYDNDASDHEDDLDYEQSEAWQDDEDEEEPASDGSCQPQRQRKPSKVSVKHLRPDPY